MAPTPVLLPGKFHGQGSLVGCSPWGREVGHDWATSLSLFTFMHWRRKWQPTPVFLPGESQGRGSLVGCSLWGPGSQTRLSDFTFTIHFHALEKEMATHSSVLAWRIPGTGGARWAGVYGVAQSRTRLKRLSSSSSSSLKGVIWGYGAPSRGNIWKKSLGKNGVKITIISKTI